MNSWLAILALVGCAGGAPQRRQDQRTSEPEERSAGPQQDPIPEMVGSIDNLPVPDNQTSPQPPDASPNGDLSNDFLESPTPRSPEKALGDRWNACMKEFVEAQRESARQPLIDALALYFTSCDKVERRIVVETPRPVPSGHKYFIESYVSLEGQLAKGRSKMWLRVVYHGDSWIFADRITVASDEFRWNSPRMQFARDHDTTVWEIGSIPYDKKLSPIVRKIIDGADVTIRFYGKEGYVDLEVTTEMKADLRVMADALAGIGIP